MNNNGSPPRASLFQKLPNLTKRFEPLTFIWWCFALSILCGTLARFTTAQSGAAYYVLVVAGSGGCAWFWFLSRALFRKRIDVGPKVFAIVPAIILVEAIAALVSPIGTQGLQNEVARIADNVASMVCIAAIVFVWREVLHSYKKVQSHEERRFRIMYIAGFSVLVAVSILWVSGAGARSVLAEWIPALLSACAFIALGGTRLAIYYRLRNPYEKTPLSDSLRLESIEKENTVVSQRIIEALKDDTLLTTPNLKVSEFANHIGEQEYKVTRCITNCLNYRNFNHLLNSYRIDRAKSIFANSESHHLSISTVAYDCGFNSLGPFNRAFKQYTGKTPREFRQK